MSTFSRPPDERKQRILKAVVHEHVQTAEPVGSESLVQRYDFGVRSATIRSELAELSDMGYLRQPHTSAGRVPSDQGYRFYVDRLMEPALLERQQKARARRQLSSVASELGVVLAETCRVLTRMTRYTSVVTQPSVEETLISHVGLSKIAGKKLLLVVVLSDGRVEHCIVGRDVDASDTEVAQVSSTLASQFAGVSAEAVSEKPEAASHSTLYDAADAALKRLMATIAKPDGEVFVEGTKYVLKQPEFQDIIRLEAILNALEERTQLYQMLSRIVLGPDVTVIIGTENPYREMQDTSFIAARYSIGGHTAGTIGVIGPTRMDYQRAVAAVQAMASNLSELLTELSLS